MVMAALFESLIHPFTIITSVVFAMIGVFLIFWLTGTNLSSISYLGILVVSGLVVNNGIILVDHINQTRRRCEDRREAIIKAGKDRIRPILMTAATTNLGLLPMIIPLFLPSVFGPIEGRAGTWAPVGLAVFGGLTTSTFLTLIILPTLYSLMDDFKNSLVRIFRRV
jgi:HAE1 family hydrophobic/amphiphilic exporter-1